MNEPSPGREARQAAQCEVFFELYGADRKVNVGRMLKGNESGRVVLLRELQLEPTEQELESIDLARGLAAPCVVKVLGIVAGSEKRYLASEYVPGCAFVELRERLRELGTSLPADVALRLIADTLRACLAVRELLEESLGSDVAIAWDAQRLWLAEFGDVLVVEPGISDEARAPLPGDDVSRACVELVQLVTGKSFDLTSPDERLALLPPELRQAVERGLGRSAQSVSSMDELLQCFEGLTTLPAGSSQVGQELERVLARKLAARRRTISALSSIKIASSESLRSNFESDATQVFRAPKPSDRPKEDWQDGPTRIGPAPALAAALRERRATASVSTTPPPSSAPSPSSAPPASSAPPTSSAPPASSALATPDPKRRFVRTRLVAAGSLAVLSVVLELMRRGWLRLPWGP